MGTYYTIMYCQHGLGLMVFKIINNATQQCSSKINNTS